MKFEHGLYHAGELHPELLHPELLHHTLQCHTRQWHCTRSPHPVTTRSAVPSLSCTSARIGACEVLHIIGLEEGSTYGVKKF